MNITIKGLPEELKAQVKEAGLFRYTYGYYIVFGSILFTGLFLSYAALLFVETVWHAIAAGFALALVMGQFGFLAHDTTHKQVCGSDKVNLTLGETIWGLVLGMSMMWWEDDHNQHHQETNKISHDTQINEQFVFSPKQLPYISNFQRKYMLPIQHYLFLPFATLTYISISISSFFYVIDLIKHGPSRKRALLEFILLSIHFVFLFGFVFWTVGLWYGLIVLFLVHFFGGLSMGLAFAPNHKGEMVLDADEEVNFFTQIECTRNITPSLFNDFILGSLNYQVEHHLFPMLPRPLLPKARRIVKQYCKDHNITYHETTLVGSYVEIVKSLHENAQYAKLKT